MKKEGLGDRMKGYENVSRIYLQPKSYVIIRLDGKAFHTYTRGMAKPFDEKLILSMQESLKYVCDNIQGVKLGYTQSDEASIMITDTDSLITSPYFMNNLQKIVSVTASMFTAKFNSLMFHYAEKLAVFDSRAFTIPKEEVANYFLWRQKDWIRNSVNMIARGHFSHKSLHGKNSSEVKKMLFEKGVIWEQFIGSQKNGSFYKDDSFSFEKHNYESLCNLIFSEQKVSSKNKINVLSLFNGISTARLVLSDLGIGVNKYFSSEINEDTIFISKKNFEDVIEVGSITEIKYSNGKLISEKKDEFEYEIDFLCGGSSCQGFSFAGKQEGMITDENVKIESIEQYLEHKEKGFEFKGESYLFWEYIRLLKETNPKVFFLENVKMSKYNKDIITEALISARYGEEWEGERLSTVRSRYHNEDSRVLEFNESEQILFVNKKTNETEIFSINYINSGMFSAQTRRRIYWTNIPIDKLPTQSDTTVGDIIEGFGNESNILSEDEKLKMKEFGCSYSFGGRTVHLREKFPTITASYGKNSGNGGKVWLKEIIERMEPIDFPSFVGVDTREKAILKYKGDIRTLTVLEIERLMGMPDDYTKGLNPQKAIKALGNGWEKNTISFLWKNLLQKVNNTTL